LSFQDIIAFEKADPNDEVILNRFSQTLFTIRDRHANTVPTMAEAVMEVKSNYATKGNSNPGTGNASFYC
jgi:Mitochondrial branched-chain alpha-ketoacid dehydrogenase kinase